MPPSHPSPEAGRGALAWLDALAERSGASRWVVVWRDAYSTLVESSAPASHDGLYDTLIDSLDTSVVHAPTGQLGDTGRRLAVAGVETVTIEVDGDRALVLENVSEQVADPMAPPTTAVVDVAVSLCRHVRHARDTQSVLTWVGEGLRDTGPATGLATLLDQLREHLGTDDLIVLQSHGGAVRAVSSTGREATVDAARWAQVRDDPATGVSDGRRALGLDAATTSRLATSFDEELVLASSGGRAVSLDALTMAASWLSLADGWQRSLVTVQRSAYLEERNRLAMQIHEGAVQLLTNVAIQLEVIDDDTGFDATGIKAAVRDALDSLRSTILDLSPPDTDAKHPPSALRPVVADCAARWDLDVRVDDSVPSGTVDGPAFTLACAFIEEALRNVRKHSGVDEAVVSLTLDGQRLAIQVTEQGTGFDVDELRERAWPPVHGLALLWSQARSLDAELEIDTGTGRGTTITLRVPLGSAPAG